jgi:phage-related protein
MNWTVEFYKGVDKQILNMPPALQARLLRLLELIEKHGPDLGPPHTKALGDGLFEIRAKGKEGIARGIFCYHVRRRVVVLLAFVKKTQKTPKSKLDLARKRQKEIHL